MHEIISLSQKSDTALATLSANTQRLIPIIKPHLETYTQLINQLKPLTDSQNLCRLRDMYMDKLQDVDLLITSIRSKRRDYFLHLLALDVMSNNQAAHYGKNWKRAIQINRQLVLEYQKFNKQLAQVVSSEPLTVMTGKEKIQIMKKLNPFFKKRLKRYKVIVLKLCFVTIITNDRHIPFREQGC